MSYLLALAMVAVICGAQWFFTSRALASPARFLAWVSGGYVAKIALLALGLYVPRMLGMDVRIAAIATIIAIIVSSTVEMIIMARRRTINVNPHPHNANCCARRGRADLYRMKRVASEATQPMEFR